MTSPPPGLTFPHVHVVSASAGSGKTHALTRRYVQFLLSDNIPFHEPRHLLAMTFTNNAASEMKQRILATLKELALGMPERTAEMSSLTGVQPETLRRNAERSLDGILDNFSEFQVRTIDSFLTNVFKVSAIELGYSPSAETQIASAPTVRKAIRELSLRAANDERLLTLLREIIALADESRYDRTRYLWDPFSAIAERILGLYEDISSVSRRLHRPSLRHMRDEQTRSAQETAKKLRDAIVSSGLPPYSHLMKDIETILKGDISSVLGHSVKTKATNKPSPALQAAEDTFAPGILDLLDSLNRTLGELALTEARAYYRPYVEALELLNGFVERIKRTENIALLSDVSQILSSYIAESIVPELYIRLGERIYHFLIDEFQDTSPTQWRATFPLLENALSTHGSVFAVGDTKQSIYSFRGADWRIMRQLMTEPVFASAPALVSTLSTNYRSRPILVAATADIFHRRVAATEFKEAADATGLSTYALEARHVEGPQGHVEVLHVEKNTALRPELETVVSLVEDARRRGYAWGDMAVLSPANTTVIDISSALNKRNIPFLSQSSLDIRNRKIVAEIIALLRFLDAPVDDATFATVAMSDLFLEDRSDISSDAVRQLLLSHAKTRDTSPLYVLFRESFPEAWERCFKKLYERIGFLPLYDLVSSVYATFSVFERFPHEQASLVRFLECVREFETMGNNAVRDLVRESEGESQGLSWELPRQTGKDAIALMTIHKAKGLGFPVVIAVLNEWKKRGGKPVRWEREDGVELLRLGDAVARSEILSAMHGEEVLRYRADELNKLYVSLTRAQEEMYVVVVKDKEDRPPALFLPMSASSPQRPTIEPREPPNERKIPVLFAGREQAEIEVQEQRLHDREARRGEVIHAILERIMFIDHAEKQIGEAVERVCTAMEAVERETYRNIVGTFLRLPSVAEYFVQKPGRIVFTEREVADARGGLHRMDRLLVDDDAVTVIDFKTGGREMEERHSQQVRGYIDICSGLYPGRELRGVLAYIDAGQIVDVR